MAEFAKKFPKQMSTLVIQYRVEHRAGKLSVYTHRQEVANLSPSSRQFLDFGEWILRADKCGRDDEALGSHISTGLNIFR